MEKQLIKILMICFLIFNLGCVKSKQEPLELHVYKDFIKCPDPIKPNFNELGDNLSDLELYKALKARLILLKIYIKDLEKTVECYKAQIRE